LAPRRIHDPRVLRAMQTVPRHRFVPPDLQERAYADCPLPIGEHQTISQPYIVALMTELLTLKGTEKVLEIGTGSGYQAAILGKLAQEVHTVERHASLAKRAEDVLRELGCENVHVHHADGSSGLPEHAPYEGVIVTAAAPEVPKILLDQLADGGVLVIPVGGYYGQTLQRWERIGESFTYDDIAPVAFVPLRGQMGWGDGEWGI